MLMLRTLDETRAAATDARATAQNRLPLRLPAALALVYQSLAMHKPDLNNGGCACVRATAGEHIGFAAAACLTRFAASRSTPISVPPATASRARGCKTSRGHHLSAAAG